MVSPQSTPAPFELASCRGISCNIRVTLRGADSRCRPSIACWPFRAASQLSRPVHARAALGSVVIYGFSQPPSYYFKQDIGEYDQNHENDSHDDREADRARTTDIRLGSHLPYPSHIITQRTTPNITKTMRMSKNIRLMIGSTGMSGLSLKTVSTRSIGQRTR